MTRRGGARLALAALVLAGTALAAPIPADLGNAVQDGMRLGATMAWVGDFDGNGVNLLAVGADTWDGAAENQGAVFLFKLTAQGFALARILGQGVASDSRLGASLAVCDVNGDRLPDLVAGAPGSATRDSQVQVFFAGGKGSTKIDGTDLGSEFGASVACADVTGDGIGDVVVGAPQLARPTLGTRTGGVLVYPGTSTTGVFSSPLEVRGPAILLGERFGAAVASAGDLDGDGHAELLVGAPGFGTGAVLGGRVSLVRLVTSPSVKLDIVDNANGTDLGSSVSPEFGSAIAVLGDSNGDGLVEVAVGGAAATSAIAGRSGAVQLFGLTIGGFSSLQRLDPPAGALGMGRTLAAGADVNGDGYADLVVGLDAYVDANLQATGAALAFPGSADGLRAEPLVLAGPTTLLMSSFGQSVAGVGDLDGDGFSDVVVGAPTAVVGATGMTPVASGTFFLFRGGSRGPGGAFTTRPTGQPAALGGVGDLNGDGLDDYAIGYPSASTSTGAVVVVQGARSGFGNLNAVTIGAPVPGGRFGASVAGAGDVNGDGFGDLIVGAPQLNDPAMGVGGAFVFYGAEGSVDASKATPLAGVDANGFFGTSVSTAGDFDGDGFDDVVVGAPGSPEGGAITVYFGGRAGVAADRLLRIASPKAGAFFGASVAAAGDLDLDGFSDLVVGAPGVAGAVLGRVFVVHGAAAGAGGIIELGGTAPEQHGLGRSVSGAGDLNGDGLPDVIATASPPDVPGPVRAFAFLSGPVVGAVMIALPTAPVSPVQSIAVRGIGDTDGDGLGDVLLGSGDLGIGGEVRLFLGDRSGTLRQAMWRTQPMAGSESLGGVLGAVGDLNDDGFADFATASQSVTGVRLFAGGDLAPGRPYGLEQRFSGLRQGRGYHARMGEPVELRALLRDELGTLGPLQLEVELKPVRQPFNGLGTITSAPVHTGVALVTVTPPVTARYHWRARVVSAGGAGRWRVFGANDETGTDFSWGLAVVRPDGGVEPGDAGVDGGEPDGGVDAGAADGGTGPIVFDAVGCNCGVLPVAPSAALLLALLVQRARRRRR